MLPNIPHPLSLTNPKKKKLHSHRSRALHSALQFTHRTPNQTKQPCCIPTSLDQSVSQSVKVGGFLYFLPQLIDSWGACTKEGEIMLTRTVKKEVKSGWQNWRQPWKLLVLVVTTFHFLPKGPESTPTWSDSFMFGLVFCTICLIYLQPIITPKLSLLVLLFSSDVCSCFCFCCCCVCDCCTVLELLNIKKCNKLIFFTHAYAHTLLLVAMQSKYAQRQFCGDLRRLFGCNWTLPQRFASLRVLFCCVASSRTFPRQFLVFAFFFLLLLPDWLAK